jgi:predicted phosphodiesterase
VEDAVRIGLLSDTHDRVPAVAELLRRFAAAEVTLVLHAGDFCAPFSMLPFHETPLTLLGVYGRNDGDRDTLASYASALPGTGELFQRRTASRSAGTTYCWCTTWPRRTAARSSRTR